MTTLRPAWRGFTSLRGVVGIGLAVLVAGCDQFRLTDSQGTAGERYEITSYEGGLARMDKHTGEVTLITKGGVTKYGHGPFTTPANGQEGDSDLEILAAPRTEEGDFPESGGSFWYTLAYKWRNEKILYRYTFGPYAEELHSALQDMRSTLILNFFDADGFTTARDDISLSSLTRVIGEQAEPVEWRYEGTVICTRGDFKLTTTVNIGSRFADDLRESIAKSSEKAKQITEELLAKLTEFSTEGYLEVQVAANRVYKTENGLYSIIHPSKYREMIQLGEQSKLLRSSVTPVEESEPEASNVIEEDN